MPQKRVPFAVVNVEFSVCVVLQVILTHQVSIKIWKAMSTRPKIPVPGATQNLGNVPAAPGQQYVQPNTASYYQSAPAPSQSAGDVLSFSTLF